MIALENNIEISDTCLEIICSRSSGPGGQHVNKVNTRITVIFDLEKCDSLSEEQKARIKQRLKGNFDKKCRIHVSSQEFRSQWSNRNDALEKLRVILDKALQKKKIRKKTKVPARINEKRLEAKRRRTEIKRNRSNIY